MLEWNNRADALLAFNTNMPLTLPECWIMHMRRLKVEDPPGRERSV